MSAPGVAELGINPDSDLQKVLDIAAFVGDIGSDEVNVSYTSLLIGLMWSGDPVSRWLVKHRDELGVKTPAIYGRRSIGEGLKDEILAKVSSGMRPTPRTDFYSVSARTVLKEAVSIAQDTGRLRTAALGTRHVAAVYFFRNPPGHNTQLYEEWGFDKELWRKSFAQFVEREYKYEFPTWSHVLRGFIPGDPADTAVSGEMLKGYEFDAETVGVLRALQSEAAKQAPPVLYSENLLYTLAGSRSVPDCAAFADMVAERLEVEVTASVPAAGAPFAESVGHYRVTHGLENIVRRARSVTRSVTGTDTIGVRHLIASILVDQDSTANLRIVQSGISLPFVRSNLLKDFTRRHFNDEGVQWRLILVGPTPPTIAGFHSDSADCGDDRLDVTRYARAFAIVIAAEQVNPPVSIGIFGDWGSGKSFFMRLMAEQTEATSKLAATDAAGKRLFCQRIVPVTFNAWHYAEGNLWASLVQTILQRLRTEIVGDKDDESALMDRILENLQIVKVARTEAKQALDAANAQQEQSEKELAAARADAAAKAAKVTTVKTTDVVDIVRKTLFPKLDAKDAVLVAARYLKIEGAATLAEKNVGQVEELLKDGRIVAARTRSSFDWLWHAPVSWSEIGVLVGVALAVLLVCAWLTGEFPHAWSAFYSGMVEIAAVLGLAVPWARRHLETISKGMGQFDSIRGQIDERLVQERARTAGALAEAERQHAEAVAKADQAGVRLTAANERVAQAEREVDESRSVNRIARLLEERLNGKSYEHYLGIIAAIRSDFEKLSRLMTTMRTEAPVPNAALRPIDRIVLYIDDLDRCPSDRVVSTLEAIHLLLAFELFVVVVGVDIRWAARALAQKYPNHLSAGIFDGRGQVKPGEPPSDGVTALDYLEKIFQIPFWLPPMEEDASRNMIAEMVPRPLEKTVTPAQTGLQEHVEEKNPEPPKAGEQPRSPGDAPALASDPSPPEVLAIEAEERNFMLGLAGAVGKSPRRLKRFVNTYRVLKASLDGLQRINFVTQYRASMALLALVTAAPRSSPELLEQLAGLNEDDLLDAFEKCVSAVEDVAEKQYAMSALAAYRKADPALTVKELKNWAPDVARFSFRSART